MNDTITVEAGTVDLLDMRTEQAVATVERGGELTAPTVNDGDAVRGAILELARDSSFDVEKLRALTEMQERAEDRQAQRAFNRDMASAQAECQAVVRGTEVKLIKDGESKGAYKYASLDAIDEMIRPIMTKYGFSITYDRAPRQGDGGGFVVAGTLRHREGHEITASFALSLDSGPGRSNAQAAGSTDSYGRKYILLGFFNIVRRNEDDDGVANGLLPLNTDAEGRKKAERLRTLVTEAGIGTDAKTDLDKRAAVLGWFHERLDYEVTNYLDVRQEDYARLVRLLRIEAQAKEARDRKEADI